MTTKRLPPADRRALILDHALALSERGDYRRVTRKDVATRAGIAESLVSYYLGTVTEMRRAIMRAAVARECVAVVAQGLAAKDRFAQRAPAGLRAAAVASLG